MGYPIIQIVFFYFSIAFLRGLTHFLVNFKLFPVQNGITLLIFTISRFFIVILHKIKELSGSDSFGGLFWCFASWTSGGPYTGP